MAVRHVVPRLHKEAQQALIDTVDTETRIRNLLASQRFAVLSTQEQDHPYLSMVAFTETGDLRSILFATTKDTRKYGNISAVSGVALLVDNRTNEAADVSEAMALTIIGTAREVPDSKREELDGVYLEKQPHMEEFLSSPSTALIRVDVESYILVSHFQEVATLNLKL